MDVSVLVVLRTDDSSYGLDVRARGGGRGNDDCNVCRRIVESLLQHLTADDIHLASVAGLLRQMQGLWLGLIALGLLRS